MTVLYFSPNFIQSKITRNLLIDAQCNERRKMFDQKLLWIAIKYIPFNVLAVCILCGLLYIIETTHLQLYANK